MKKLLLILGVFFAFALTAQAQTQTVVSACVTDPNGLPYAAGAVSVTLTPTGGPAPTVNNGPIQGSLGPTPLDANGCFQISLWPNGAISPAGTKWQFTISNPGAQPPVGFGPVSFTPAPITIVGSTQSLTATLSAASVLLWNDSAAGGSGLTGTLTPTNILFALGIHAVSGVPHSSVSGVNITLADPGGDEILFLPGGGPNVRVQDVAGNTGTYQPTQFAMTGVGGGQAILNVTPQLKLSSGGKSFLANTLSIVIPGSTSGTATLQATAIEGTNTQTLPDATGIIPVISGTPTPGNCVEWFSAVQIEDSGGACGGGGGFGFASGAIVANSTGNTPANGFTLDTTLGDTLTASPLTFEFSTTNNGGGDIFIDNSSFAGPAFIGLSNASTPGGGTELNQISPGGMGLTNTNGANANVNVGMLNETDVAGNEGKLGVPNGAGLTLNGPAGISIVCDGTVPSCTWDTGTGINTVATFNAIISQDSGSGVSVASGIPSPGQGTYEIDDTAGDQYIANVDSAGNIVSTLQTTASAAFSNLVVGVNSAELDMNDAAGDVSHYSVGGSAFSFTAADTVTDSWNTSLTGGVVQSQFTNAAGSFLLLNLNGTTANEVLSDISGNLIQLEVIGGVATETVSNGIISSTRTASTLQLPGVLVAALPTAAAGNEGSFQVVTDSTTLVTEGQTCVGGNPGNIAFAFSNGTVWKCF